MDIWSRAAVGGRWMRDSFASWFTTSWLYIILWGVVAIAFTVLLYIDGVFSRSLAPDSIEPLSFQAMGWAYRFFAAAFLMAAARCVFKGIKGKWTFRLLGLFASVIVVLHALGFGLEALSERREQAMALRDVSGVQEQSIADQRSFLEERKAQIDADLSAQVSALDAEIRQYITDGLNNDYLADETRERRTQLQDTAAAQKQALDEQIMALVVSQSDARTETIQTEANAQPWHPLFIGLGQLAFQTWEPTDKQVYLSAVGFVFFWVLLAEALVIFLPERIYVMHLQDAEAAKRSEAARKGWEKRKEKEPEPEVYLPLEDTGFVQDVIPKMVKMARRKTTTTQGIADTYFAPKGSKGSVPELRGWLGAQLKKNAKIRDPDFDGAGKAPLVPFTRDHYNTILMESMPQAVNGHDKQEDNPEPDMKGQDDESGNIGDQPDQTV